MIWKRFAIGFSVCSMLVIAASVVHAEDEAGDGGMTITNAQGQGWYVFGQVGGSNADLDAPNLYPSGAVSGVNIDREDLLDFAWGAGAGWRFNDLLAFEAGWLDLGEWSGSYESGAFKESRTIGVRGARLRALVYYAPPYVQEEGSRLIELFAGPGLLIYETNADASCALPGAVNPDCIADQGSFGREPKPYRKQDDSGESFNISVGGQVNFTQGTGLRVSYYHYFGVSGIDVDAVMAEFVISYRGFRELIGFPIQESSGIGYY